MKRIAHLMFVVVIAVMPGCSKKSEDKSVPRPSSVPDEVAAAPGVFLTTWSQNEAALHGTDCARATEAYGKILDGMKQLGAAAQKVDELAKSDPKVAEWAKATFEQQASSVAMTIGMKTGRLPDAPCKDDPAFKAKLKETGPAMGFKGSAAATP